MPIVYEKKDKIAYVTINRPEAMNAMDYEMWQGLFAAIDDFRDDAGSWVMIITGAGDKAFSTGADLTSVISSVAAGEMDNPTIVWFKDIYKPIIAAVNGICFAGAMEMVLATDIRIASENAVFSQAEARWGILTSAGGTVRLARQVAWCHAMELLFTADRITAQDAYRIGLVNRVVPPDQLMSTAETIARRICENAPLVVRAMKEAAMRSKSMPLDQALALESFMGKHIFTTQDAAEGPKAFAERRKPNFMGK